jgi:hypothetical protein
MKVLPIIVLLLAVVLLLFSRSLIFQLIVTEMGYFGPDEFMQAIVSIGIGAAALIVILAQRFAPKDKHWAYATLGTIIGF